MASRMDRYNDRPGNSNGRSRKNEDLYKRIQDMDSYSNIEAVHTIAKTNEIDITKVRELIKNRENYKREKQYRNAFNIEDKPKEKEIDKFFQDEKTYDIMDVLDKAKVNHNEDKANRSLKKMHYDVINELNLRNEKYDDSEEELKDLINTITNKNDSEDVGLLDNLTSNTMVGDASSIHKIVEEEKEEQKKNDNTAEMDKSFFTSTMSFSDEDFEEFKNMGKHVRKNNILIIILMIIIILAIIGFVIFLLMR